MQDKDTLVKALEALLSVLHSMPDGAGHDMDSDHDGDTDMNPTDGDPKLDMSKDAPPTKVDVTAMTSPSSDEDDSLESLRKRPGYMGK